MEFLKNLFRKKTQEEIDAEEELQQVQEQLKRDQEALSGKKPFSGKKVLTYGLATAIGAGVAFEGSKMAGDYVGSRIPTGKAERKVSAKEVKAPGFQLDTTANMTKVLEQARLKQETPIPAPELKAMQTTPEPAPTITKRPTAEEVMKEINAKFDQKDEELRKIKPKITQTAPKPKSAPVEKKVQKAPASAPAPKPEPKQKTYEERIEEIRKKIEINNKGGFAAITPEEADLWNRNIPLERARINAERERQMSEISRSTQINTKAPEQTRPPSISEKETRYGGTPTTPHPPKGEIREDFYGGSFGGYGFGGHGFESGLGHDENGYFSGGPMYPYPQDSEMRGMSTNPYNLSMEMLNRTETLYKKKIEEIFRNHELNWLNIRYTSAHKFMKKSEEKLTVEEKKLKKFIASLEKETGITTTGNWLSTRKQETTDHHIRFLLQNAAARVEAAKRINQGPMPMNNW